MNQNSPIMAALIGGTRNGRPTAMHRIAAPIRVFCCTGSFSFLSSTKQLAPEPINNSAGNNVLSGNSVHGTFGKGRSQPPQKSVTATEDTTKMFAYSARK